MTRHSTVFFFRGSVNQDLCKISAMCSSAEANHLTYALMIYDLNDCSETTKVRAVGKENNAANLH